MSTTSSHLDTRGLQQITEPPKIAIIGSGVSGLRAAARLSELFPHSHEKPFITILEGRSRLGGRLAQVKLPRTDHLVDTGPNWIHGTEDNPIYDLAKELGETTGGFGEESESTMWDENGKLVHSDISKDVVDGMWSVIVQASQESNEKFALGSIDESKTLYDYFEEKVKSMWEDDASDVRDQKRKLCLQLSDMWGAFVGGNVKRQSLKFFWLEECLEGENLFLASTYKRILEWMIDKVQNSKSCEIRLNTTITSIDYSAQTNHADPSRIKLTTTSNEVLTFDQVIVTSPLGWLQKNLTTFKPSLPAHITQAIQEIGYGNLEKAYITFPSAFWDNVTDGGTTPANASTHFLAPKYANETNPHHHNVGSISLSQLENGCGHPTLLFYLYDEQARIISHDLSTKANEEEKEQYLIDYFMPYISKLPGYSTADQKCQPVSAYFTDWLADDLAGNGSYSNFMIPKQDGPGQVHGKQALDKSVEIIRDGLPEVGMWFAGEHTAPFAGLGTVTGAYISGEAVADRIGKLHGVGVDVTHEVER